MILTHKQYQEIRKTGDGFHLNEGGQTNAFLCKSDIVIMVGNRGCVDADTEYFNGEKWVRIADYRDSDKVLQYNEDGTSELVYPEQYHKYECEELTLMQNRTKTINQCLSDEHNLVYVTSKGNLFKQNFGTIKKRWIEKGNVSGDIITAFDYSGGGIDWTDDEIKLALAVSAESYLVLNKSGTRRVRINVKHEYKKKELELLLDAVGINYKKTKRNNKDRAFDNYTFFWDKAFKEIPAEWYRMNRGQFELVKKNIIIWDGGKNKNRGEHYSTTIKANADFFQFCCSSLGYKAHIGEREREKYKTVYRVGIFSWKCNAKMLGKGRLSMTPYKTKDGYKYCFSVPSGMLVLRRENAINITGNSAKTTTILLGALPHIFDKKYNCYYLRKEVKDATGGGGILDAAKSMFSQFGTFRDSLQYLDCTFTSGARASFINYSAPIKEFKDKVQGKEITHINIDEITQLPLTHFGILLANLRNTIGIRPQLRGTCNPDANSWIKDLIAPYLDFEDKYHRHKKDMNGKEIYFFQKGSKIKDCVYGSTKEEVYQHCKEEIQELIDNSQMVDADPYDAILSMSVFYIGRHENRHLMESGGGGLAYDARLGQMSLQERIYATFGGWKKVDDDELALVKVEMLDKMYKNPEMRTGKRFASMDLSGKGSDKTFLLIWDGYHLEKIYTTQNRNAKELYEWTCRILSAENIPRSRKNFVYDAGGLGFAFSGYFSEDEAFEFQSNSVPSEESGVLTMDGKYTRKYRNLRAEVCGKFMNVLTNFNDTGECGLSIDKGLLETEHYGMSIRRRMEAETRGLRWKDTGTDGVFQLIGRDDMNFIIGFHPDFIMAVLYRFALDINDRPDKKIVSEEPTDEDMSEIGSFFFM